MKVEGMPTNFLLVITSGAVKDFLSWLDDATGGHNKIGMVYET